MVTLTQAGTGSFFGISQLLQRAAAEFSGLKRNITKPTVLLVGEIYVRGVEFANDYIIDRLEQRGCRVRLAATHEWLEYVDYLNRHRATRRAFSSRVSSFIQTLITRRFHEIVAHRLDFPAHAMTPDILDASAPYLRDDLEGEAVLTLGRAIHDWHDGDIDGVVSVGPFECMPNKIAETQFVHVGTDEGLPSVTLSLTGDPLSPDALDNFLFEVNAAFERRRMDQIEISRGA